jgi:glycosyltransferase involved in cell wall biosynthesis
VSTQIAQRGHATESEQLGNQRDEQHDVATTHANNVSAAPARVHVIIPALDEEAAIAAVLRSLRQAGFAELVVVDNGSRDRTALLAEIEGARVVHEARRGYGAACLAGMAALDGAGGDDVVAFVDADGSDDARDLGAVIRPLLSGTADLVIGSRTRGVRESGALPPHARLGNRIATRLIRLRTGHSFTDLGPMRALRYATLLGLAMRDRDFGWTVEMQIKAVRSGLRIVEVPVRYRRRIGQSKITGTVLGSMRAGLKILFTIAKYGR